MNKEDIIEQVKDKLPSIIDVNQFQYIPEEDIGYFGRVTSSDFITYKDLCDQLSFHESKLMKDVGWLLFWYKGELLYISQHPVRYYVAWDDINKHNLVFGERSVDIRSNNYSVMLPTGGNKEDNDTGSMWNDLIYKVHEEFGIWDKLTDEELNVNCDKCPVGTASWCQERYDSDDERYPIRRGYIRLSHVHASYSAHANSRYGVRLVLKLNKDIE